MSPQLKRIRTRAETVTRDFTAEDWAASRPGKWSAGEIFEHLILSFSGTTKGLLRAMELAEPVCREVTVRDRVAQFYVVQLGIFPGGRKSPNSAQPTGVPLHDPLRRFNDALVAMNATLFDAERRFGNKTRLLEHPALGPLTAEQWRRFHRVHAFHHLAQIAALRGTAKALRVSA